MNTKFLDGQAVGVDLNLRRAPAFLRVVYNQRERTWDALDQLDDEPSDDELIYVYLLDGDVATGIACSRGRGGSGCRRFHFAEYRIYKTQPCQEELRDNDFWQRWTKEEWDKLDTKPAGVG